MWPSFVVCLFIFQQIVYEGYLRSYMDPDIGDLFGLGIGAPDKKCSYNNTLDPTIFNCFGIVYRYVLKDKPQNWIVV